MSLTNIQLTLSSKEERQRLIESGIEAGKEFILDQKIPLVEKVDAVVLDDSIQELS